MDGLREPPEEHVMTDEAEDQLRVEDALDAGDFRVRPDMPLSEAVDLMVREGLRAIPVVGESSEVMGILTSGDALAQVLGRGGEEEEGRETEGAAVLVRDRMARSVLCVSVDQPLNEAANTLVNRGVDQLPVVREGEFVGFITADSILAAFAGTGLGEPASPPGKDKRKQRKKGRG